MILAVGQWVVELGLGPDDELDQVWLWGKITYFLLHIHIH
ncbi:MAG: hypothetical protein ACI88A_000338, partial [Paraglaciecola sp.]